VRRGTEQNRRIIVLNSMVGPIVDYLEDGITGERK